MNGWIERAAKKIKIQILGCLGGALVSALLTGAVTVSAEEIYRPTAAIPMPNGLALANFDIVWADSVLGMVFFTERSSKSVVAIDTTTNRVVALLGQGRFVGITTDATVFDSGPNGVTVVDHKEVWAGDGDSSVKVINIASGALRSEE